MIELPRPLQPWAAQLSLFERDIALALGALIVRLASLVGTGQPKSSSLGALNGFDGIAPRGSYDRLLAHEWLLLDELPDEFLRRAIANEHSFLRRAHQDDSAGKRCIVVFDCGVDQLGAPRIAHLALLVLLARRAETMRAQFLFGVLQDPSTTLHDGVTAATVKSLLAVHAHRHATADDRERWRPMIEGAESWSIGTDAWAPHSITIADVLEPHAPSRLAIRATSAQALAKEILVEIPPAAIAVRLLRDPFGAAPASHARAAASKLPDVSSELVFSANGRHLYVRGADPSSLLTLTVPSDPGNRTPRPIAITAPHGHTILAVGRWTRARRTYVVTQNNDEVFLHALSNRGASIYQTQACASIDGYTLPRLPTPSLSALAVFEDAHACFVTDYGDVVQVDARLRSLVLGVGPARGFNVSADSARWVTVDNGVLKMQSTFGAARTSNELSLSAVSIVDGLPPIAKDGRVLFGGAFFAYPIARDEWNLVHHTRRNLLNTSRSDGSRTVVVGVASRHLGRAEPALIVWDGDRQLCLQGNGGIETIATTTSPIHAVAVGEMGNLIAFMTGAATISIYSCKEQRVTAFYDSDGAVQP